METNRFVGFVSEAKRRSLILCLKPSVMLFFTAADLQITLRQMADPHTNNICPMLTQFVDFSTQKDTKIIKYKIEKNEMGWACSAYG